MTQFDSKVVSFERKASFLHERALKNKKSGREADALELMRQAVRKEPENTRYQLDLAMLLSEMGLFEQASMAIEKVLLSGNMPPECLYAMGMIQYSRGDVSKAERLIRAYTEMGEGERIAEAKRLIDEILIAKEAMLPDRKTLRAMRCVDRACRMMTAGDHAGAEKMFLLAMRMNDSSPEVHALYAMNLHMWGKDDAALTELERAHEDSEKYSSGMLRVQCISAQIFASMGRRDKAQDAIDAAVMEEAQGHDLRLLLNAMFESGYHERVREYLPRALSDAPYDKILLHALSVSAYHLNLPEEEILSGWKRIERMDPLDPVCKYYIRLSNDKNKYPISYVYRMPPEEMMNRAKVIMNAMFMGDDRLKEIWETDEEFRNIVNWEIYQPDGRFTRLALSALMGANTDETEKRVKVFADRPDIPMDLRNYVMSGRAIMGKPLKMELPDEYVHAGMPTEDELMGNFSVGEKQMIRYAAEYVEDKYRDYPVADIALIWHAFKEHRGSLGVSMVSTEAGSAALAMCCLNMKGKNDDIYTVSRWYGCSPRQAAYIARLIRNSIQSVPER